MKKLYIGILAGIFHLPLSNFASAEQPTVLSTCQDGLNGNASQTEAELAKFLQGSWQMRATGTGFTTGKKLFRVTLRFDEDSGSLRMEGQGRSAKLTPLAFSTNDDGNTKDKAPFDMSSEALTPLKLSPTDLEILNGCGKPTRYWWRLGSGSRKSWGGLMFINDALATGFIANSAGGTRKVTLQR